LTEKKTQLEKSLAHNGDWLVNISLFVYNLRTILV